MTRIEAASPVAKTAAAAAAAVVALAGASGAVAAAAIDVPAQSFGQGQAGSRAVVKWRPNASSWVRERPTAAKASA